MAICPNGYADQRLEMIRAAAEVGAHLAVEKPFLIDDRRDQAAGVHALPFGKQLAQKLERDQQGLQRIVANGGIGVFAGRGSV